MKDAQLVRYLRTFWFASSVSILTLIAVLYYLGPEAALVALLLIILEVTFSFDNAVVNARVLRHMSPFWQKIFLTIGILIAVFGMRIVFPIALVAVTAGLSMGEVLNLAFNQPDRYSEYLESAQPSIAAFGGMFLLLVFLTYFISENNGKHWLKPVEGWFDKIPKRWFSAPLISLVLLFAMAIGSGELFRTVMTSGIIGIGVYVAMHAAVDYMQSRHMADTATKLTGLGGLAAFLYLEVLDASFSLDGVIGAFAITSSVVLIAAGLGVGAVWVRSMTVYLVRHETLGKYVYLEQGAHYAIGLLAFVLIGSLFVHVPEVFTGLAGVTVIILSVISSRRYKHASATLKNGV